jgi:hypothetical protein
MRQRAWDCPLLDFVGVSLGFCGVSLGFLSQLCYKFFLGIETVRGPQELRIKTERAWDCPPLDFDGYRTFFWFLPGFRGVLSGFCHIPVML